MRIRRAYRWLRSRAWLYWNLFKDKRTPWISKILIIAAVIYLIWPIDIIPDFIPFVGFVDEVIIIPFLFMYLGQVQALNWIMKKQIF